MGHKALQVSVYAPCNIHVFNTLEELTNNIIKLHIVRPLHLFYYLLEVYYCITCITTYFCHIAT